MLNPKWYEGILEHGYEGVRQIESHVTNTVGWSATTGQVAPWVYQRLTETFIRDEAMRKRLASLNPSAAVKVAHRLLEAQERQYWDPDEESLDACQEIFVRVYNSLDTCTDPYRFQYLLTRISRRLCSATRSVIQ